LAVTLNSIGSPTNTLSWANLTITKIHEEMPGIIGETVDDGGTVSEEGNDYSLLIGIVIALAIIVIVFLVINKLSKR